MFSIARFLLLREILITYTNSQRPAGPKRRFWGGVFPGIIYRLFPVDGSRVICYHWTMKLMKLLLVVIAVFSFLVIGYVIYLYFIVG